MTGPSQPAAQPVDRTQPVYTFLPWVREGFAALVGGAATQAQPADGRLGVQIRLRINQGAAEFDVPLKLNGPGDVTGIDPREIVRTDPVHLTADFEPTYFPAIEFDRPDFPWLFTPAAPDAKQRLRPWLCLVVVPKVSAVSLRQAEPLAVLTCPRGQLPDLTGSWAWAHAQVAWTRNPKLTNVPDRGQIELAMANNPERTVSRILSLRSLEPNEGYYACLVPTYAVGVKAGLGQEITAADETALAPAWSTTEGSASDQVTLPVYYHWEFATGLSNSFEPLVRRLRPNPIPPSAGRVRLDVHDPGWGIPPLPASDPAASMALEGVLKVGNGASGKPSDEPPERIARELRRVLDPPPTTPGTDPLVLPPLYGGPHAGESAVPSNGTHPWVRQLNLDPRWRAAAGLGTLVVRYQQELLMAAAWEQAAQTKKEQQESVQEKLASHVRGALCERFMQFSPERLAQVTEPLHGSVPVGTSTVKSTVHESSLPDEALSPSFRRLTRARGPLARRVTAGGDGGDPSEAMTLVRRMTDEAGVDPPEALATRALRAGALGAAMRAPAEVASRISSPASAAPSEPATAAGGVGSTDGGSPIASSAPAGGGGTVAASATPQTEVARAPVGAAMARATLADRPLPFLASAMQSMLVAELMPAPDELESAAAEPEASPGTATAAEEKALPYFPQPMYELLRDYFPELFFPGMEHVPPNTVALLQTNQRFIEAYMVGLNHEMSRELLWREFVTDYRGTYFRRFWDVPGSTAPEFLPIRNWTKALGANRMPAANAAAKAAAARALEARARLAPLIQVRDQIPAAQQRLDEANALVAQRQAELNAVIAAEPPRTVSGPFGSTAPNPMHGAWGIQQGMLEGALAAARGEAAARANELAQLRAAAAQIPELQSLAEREERAATGIEGNLVLLIRGDLLRRFPAATIYASKAAMQGGKPTFVPTAKPVQPIFRGTRAPDVTFLGFPIPETAARSKGSNAGYFFVIQEQPTEPRFGWEQHDSAMTEPTNSAGLANRTLQRAFRVAIHADAILP